MRTVNFEIHDETSAVRLSAEWDDLAQEVGRRVATRPSYVLAWNRMGRGRSAVCTVRRDGRLVGLAPCTPAPVSGSPLYDSRLTASPR